MTITSIEDCSQWDHIVNSFQEHDVYYLSGYAKGFQAHGDGQPMLFYYESKELRAINVVMKRDIALSSPFLGKLEQGVYFDLITPYGYGGFLTEGKLNADLLKVMGEEYDDYCCKNNIVSEYVRFHPMLKNSERLADLYEVTDHGKTVFIALDSPESIWEHLSSKNRNMVRKAQKAGIQIFWGRSPELTGQFATLYHNVMDSNHADEYYYFKKPYYDSLLFDLSAHSLVFYAVYLGNIIAAAVILYENGRMHYHLSASDQNFRYLAPANLLRYEAACWGSLNHFRTFHLGGGLHSREDNLYRFKKAFHTGPDAIYSTGKKCFQQELYNRLVSIRAAEKEFDRDASFFPLYRMQAGKE